MNFTTLKNALPIFNFSIQNTASGEVDIHIDGDIVDASTQEMMKNWFGDETSVSFRSFRNQVTSSNASTFNIYINSGGGSLIEALAMHDLIVDMQAKGKVVNTIGRGIIASAATYILMAGKSPEMSANSWMMIHNVSGFAWGNVNELEQYAATLRQFNDKSRDFYSEYTGIRKEDITKMMNAETWLPADEAKAKGFIKNISGSAEFTQRIPRDRWQFQNTAVLNAYNAAVAGPPDNSISTQIQNQFDSMKKFFTDIVNSIKGITPVENATQADLVSQIADAVSKPFESLSDEIENTITQKVDAAKLAITNELKTAYDEKIAGLESANADLKKKNEDLEQDMTTKLGGQSVDNSSNDAPAPIGTFNKKK